MATDLYDRVKEDVAVILRALDLDGVEARVLNLPTLDGVNLSFPCVVVTSEDEAEELLGGTTQTTHKRFPVRVFLLDRENLRADNAAKFTRWRKAMIDALHERARDADTKKILNAAPEVCALTVVPRVIFDSSAGKYQLVVSGFVAKAEAFEQRG